MSFKRVKLAKTRKTRKTRLSVKTTFFNFDQTDPQTMMRIVAAYTSLIFSLVQYAASEFHAKLRSE
jgi:hypothetical protein